MSPDHYSKPEASDPNYTLVREEPGYYDFATSIGFQIDAITTLPQGSSDHLPIQIDASLQTNPTSPTKVGNPAIV